VVELLTRRKKGCSLNREKEMKFFSSSEKMVVPLEMKVLA